MSWPIDYLPPRMHSWVEKLTYIRDVEGVPSGEWRMIDFAFMPSSVHSLATRLNHGDRKIPIDVRWEFRGRVRWERRPRGEEVHVGRIDVRWFPWEDE